MYEPNDIFTPEQVDEQIERLSTDLLSSTQKKAPEQILVQELQETYGNGHETTQAIEHVWQRLESSHGHLMTHHASSESSVVTQNTGSSFAGRMTSVKEPQKRTLWQIIGTLVAMLLVAILVGGMMLITRAANQTTTSDKHTSTPASTHIPISPPTPYIYTAAGLTLTKLDPFNGAVQWHYHVEDSSYQLSPAIGIDSLTVLDNTIYFSVEYKKLYAVNASNGQLRWSYMLPSQIHLNSLFPDGQTLYLSSADDPNTSSGSTCVIGLADGHLLKCYPLQALAIHKGIIYGFSGSDDLTGRINLYAFSMENNQQLWQEQIPIPHEIFEQLVYNDGVLYTTSEIINKNYRLPSTDSYVSAFDAQTGHFLWQSSQKANDVITSLPTVGNGEVYYSSQDGYSYAINATNGQFLWKILISHEVTVENYSSSADGWLYMGVVSYSGYPHITYLTELNAASGKQIWKYSLLNYAGDRLFLLNGLIYTSTNDGKVHALKASDGSPVWETNVDKSFTGLFMKTSMIIAP